MNLGPIGSRRDYVEFRRDGDENTVRTGCFAGTPDEFVAAVKHKAVDDPHRREYEAVVIPAMRAWFEATFPAAIFRDLVDAEIEGREAGR